MLNENKNNVDEDRVVVLHLHSTFGPIPILDFGNVKINNKVEGNVVITNSTKMEKSVALQVSVLR